ncbi:MAG: hypothetical protein RL154_1549 [Pseudomonadota bacterium]
MFGALFDAKIEAVRLMDALGRDSIEDAYLKKCFLYARVRGNAFVLTFSKDLNFELRYKKEDIKAKMRILWNDNKEELKANGVVFSSVIFEHNAPKPIEIQNEYPKIEDRSTGEFENRCRDEGLRARIEKIRSIIKEWKNS